MARLTLTLLGEFRARDETEGELALPSRKAQALLAYLASPVGPKHSREKLAALLWDDRFDDQARHSLRQCLLAIRKALDVGDNDIVVAEGDTLGLDGDLVETDVERFERLIISGARADLEQAIALYAGDLLDGLQTKSEGIDEWLVAERGRLRGLAAEAHWALALRQAQSKELDQAIETAQNLLKLEPAHEEAHRLLMQLQAHLGHHAAALRQYQACEEALRRSLDMEPSAKTVELLATIRESQQTGQGSRPLELVLPLSPKTLRRRKRLWWVLVASAVVLLLSAGATTWILVVGKRPSLQVVDLKRMSFPLPEKPSIAILPFINVNGDPSDDLFIDGITEGITTALSMVSEMFVIARNSALTYKGKPVMVPQVAEELGVRYVLEGSVQRLEDRVRINAQLIDAVEGYLLWANTFDREMTDVFALQDEIILEIITALQVEMTEGEQDRISLIHGTKNLQAWVTAGQALHYLRRLTRADTVKARDLYRRAALMDPDYPGAWAGLAWTHFIDVRFGWTGSREDSIVTAATLAQKTLALDPNRPRTYALLAGVQLLQGNHDEAVALGERAVALSPNGADVTALLGLSLTFTGDPKRAIALLRRAMRLSPYYPDWYRWVLGRAYRLAGRYNDAISALTPVTTGGDRSLAPHVELAATYSQLHRISKARAEARRVLSIDPDFSTRLWTAVPPFKDPSLAQHEYDLLRRAGLPE
jgi:TolB-like protein/DNA-binding SARP family transcriptional activator